MGMKTTDLATTLTAVLQAPENMSIVILGKPGIGKTAIPAQVAEKLGLECRVINLSTKESVDLLGLPHIKDGQTTWASPLPKSGRGVLILDELTSAAPDVQLAAHHILWREKNSDLELGEGWRIIATGNEAQHKTVYRALSGPIRAGRVHIIHLEEDAEQWAKFATDRGIRPEVVAFIRWRPELLASKEIPAEGSYTSPRSWESASRVLSLNLPIQLEREMLTGTIGDSATTEFTGFLRTVRDLPSIQRVMANQAKEAIPTSTSLQYALVSNLAYHTNRTQESAMEYIARMPAEFAMLYIRDIRDHYDISTDKQVRQWIATHKSIFKE